MFKRLLSDTFLRHNAILFSASMTASFLSYLFHPVLARLLSVSEYGEVQALLALYGACAVGLGLFGSITVNVVANADAHAHEDRAARVRLVATLRKLAGRVVIVGVAVLLVASPWIGRFFQFRSVLPLVAFAATFLITSRLIFRRAFVRGTKDFKTLGWSQILESGSRLAFAATLAWIGWRAAGAMAGVVLSQAAVLYFLWRATRSKLAYPTDTLPLFGGAMRTELHFGLRIAAVGLATSLLGSGDVLVVKHLFSPDVAGLYAGISTIARTSLFVVGSVSSVLVPSVKLQQADVENRMLLWKALGLAAALSGSVSLAFALAPSAVIRLLLGGQYVSAAGLLPPLAFFMFLLAILNPLFAYDLALRRRFAAVIGPLGLAVAFGLSALHHATPLAIVHQFTLVAALLIAAFALRGAFRYART